MLQHADAHAPLGQHLPSPVHAEERIFAALDLGTNNCRLLIAAVPVGASAGDASLRVLDSFSRIVRLGEGVGVGGVLLPDAMERTMAALKACQKKLQKYRLSDTRFVATEACRRASNTRQFLEQVFDETGLSIDVISSEEEARLAFRGCASLLAREHSPAIVFDIGGGSTELMWINPSETAAAHEISDWLSVGFGVMNLSDKFGGANFADLMFDDMVKLLDQHLQPFDRANRARGHAAPRQLLSTSGTVTTLAAIHLDLPRYDRARIDGITLPIASLRDTTRKLLAMRPSERFNHPCIGPDRADFIISGCAIFEAISRLWPVDDITIADRGVREGIILSLMQG